LPAICQNSYFCMSKSELLHLNIKFKEKPVQNETGSQFI
jgi:hypothetical protein